MELGVPAGVRAAIHGAHGVGMSDTEEKSPMARYIDVVINAVNEFSATMGFKSQYRSWPDVVALACTLTFVAFVLWLVL